MDYPIKLGIGLLIGFFVCFLYPGDNRAKPIASAAFGVIGAVVGAFLSERIATLGGAGLTPQSIATAAGGALAFSLAYVGFLA
jgi:uncharacterized membrane protein YeaQ/YmgE (transglycosylase-associated protein family)